jgi:hypothetical protein
LAKTWSYCERDEGEVFVKETRARYPWPDAEEGYEYLYDEMMRVRQERGITEDFNIEWARAH